MDIERFLVDHDGVVSRAQARACGLSDTAIARRVASGAWLRRAVAVYFAIAWPWTAGAAVRVAAEWARPAGTLAAVTAAWWLGLGVDSPYPLTIVLPPGCSRRPPARVRTERRDLRGDRIEFRGLWVVDRPLAVLRRRGRPRSGRPAVPRPGAAAARRSRRPPGGAEPATWAGGARRPRAASSPGPATAPRPSPSGA